MEPRRTGDEEGKGSAPGEEEDEEEEEDDLEGGRVVSRHRRRLSGLRMSGTTLLGLISIAGTIEDTGILKLINIVHDLFHQEEIAGKDTLLGSIETWSNFERDKVPGIHKSLKDLVKVRRRRSRAAAVQAIRGALRREEHASGEATLQAQGLRAVRRAEGHQQGLRRPVSARV